MKLRNILMTVLGLVVLAISVLFGIWAKYSYWQSLFKWAASSALALLGMEFFHHGLSPLEKNYRLFSRGLRGLFIDLLYLSLAVLLMVGTVRYSQHPTDPACGGDLGAGFPIAILCDNAGESPISDWGKISWIDIPNPIGIFLDIIFYIALLWMISYLALRIIRR